MVRKTRGRQQGAAPAAGASPASVAGPTPPSVDDLKALTTDQVVNLPIFMMPGVPRLFADTLGVTVTMSRFVDVTILTMRQNLTSQSFVVRNTNERGLEMAAGQINGGPLLVEEGTVRMSKDVALSLASTLLRQLRTMELFTEAELAAAVMAPDKP